MINLNNSPVTLNQLLPSRYPTVINPGIVNPIDLATLLRIGGAQVLSEGLTPRSSAAPLQTLLTPQVTAAAASANASKHGGDGGGAAGNVTTNPQTNPGAQQAPASGRRQRQPAVKLPVRWRPAASTPGATQNSGAVQNSGVSNAKPVQQAAKSQPGTSLIKSQLPSAHILTSLLAGSATSTAVTSPAATQPAQQPQAQAPPAPQPAPAPAAALPVQLVTAQQLQQLLTGQQAQTPQLAAPSTAPRLAAPLQLSTTQPSLINAQPLQLLFQAQLQQQLQQQIAQLQAAAAGAQYTLPSTAAAVTTSTGMASVQPDLQPAAVSSQVTSATSSSPITQISTIPLNQLLQPITALAPPTSSAIQLAATNNNIQQALATAQILKTLGQYPIIPPPTLLPIVVTMPSIVSTAAEPSTNTANVTANIKQE